MSPALLLTDGAGGERGPEDQGHLAAAVGIRCLQGMRRQPDGDLSVVPGVIKQHKAIKIHSALEAKWVVFAWGARRSFSDENRNTACPS